MVKKQFDSYLPTFASFSPPREAVSLVLMHLAYVLSLTTVSPHQDPYRVLREARRALLPLAGLSIEVDEVLEVLDADNNYWSDPKRVRAHMRRRARRIKALSRTARCCGRP